MKTPKRYSYFDFMERRAERIMKTGPENTCGEMILTEHQLHYLINMFAGRAYCDGYTDAGGTLSFKKTW